MGRAGEEFMELAKRRAKAKGICLGEAITKVAEERPDLWELNRCEVMGIEPKNLPEPPDQVRFAGKPAQRELCTSAKLRAERTGSTLSEAMVAVCSENPLLYERARQETV